jgi:hypothetical protein
MVLAKNPVKQLTIKLGRVIFMTTINTLFKAAATSSSTRNTLVIFAMLTVSQASIAQVTQAQIEESKKTEVWEPVPDKVEAKPGQAPSDAIVLFDGTGTDKWEDKNGDPIKWKSDAYALEVTPGTGYVHTKQSFCDVQLHLEFNTASEPEKSGQNSANSGVFLQSRYEVQILDNYTNTTYPNGQVGAVYKQHIPLVNPSRPPGEWQTYDIIFKAPIFKDDKLVSPAYITVLLNGVLVQNHIEIQGQTEWIGAPKYYPHGCLPIKLQDHGSPNRFRNIWVRPL